jgi:hypothetical protein
VYATAAAVVTRQPAVIALAALWWVQHRYRYTLRHSELTFPEKVSALPGQLLIDAIQAAALLSGSVRTRTLVL